MKKQLITSLALSSAVATAGIATHANAADNPFSTSKLETGYQLAQADTKTGEGKCGEGKCGEKKEKPTEGKCGSDKTQEGKCGNKEEKTQEGNCGASMDKKSMEGKCGSNM